MNRGVLYMLIGTKHAAVLVTAVASLRNWWEGDVLVMCGDQAAWDITERLCEQMGAQRERFEPLRQKRHSGYATKPTIPAMSPFEATVQLDADTLVVGELAELWPWHPKELVISRYADWVSTGNIVANRIKRWQEAWPEAVADQLSWPYPAINTGILSYGNQSDAARRRWHEVTQLLPRTFICDEIAMQLLYLYEPCVRLLDDRWNFSPMHSPPNDDIRVIHNHGGKSTRRQAAARLWLPWFVECYKHNLGGLAEWCPAGDKHLARFLSEHPEVRDADLSCVEREETWRCETKS